MMNFSSSFLLLALLFLLASLSLSRTLCLVCTCVFTIIHAPLRFLSQLDPVFLLQQKVFDHTFRATVLSVLDRNHVFIDCEYGGGDGLHCCLFLALWMDDALPLNLSCFVFCAGNMLCRFFGLEFLPEEERYISGYIEKLQQVLLGNDGLLVRTLGLDTDGVLLVDIRFSDGASAQVLMLEYGYCKLSFESLELLNQVGSFSPSPFFFLATVLVVWFSCAVHVCLLRGRSSCCWTRLGSFTKKERECVCMCV